MGIPHFANDYINKYEYDETGLAITNPRPDAFHVKQKQKLSMGGGLSGSGHLTAFDANIQTDSGETFAVFPVPQIEFSSGTTLEIDQDIDISCVDCLSRIAVAAAADKSFSVLITGKPDLKLGALPTAHLDIHKNMHMDGRSSLGVRGETLLINDTSNLQAIMSLVSRHYILYLPLFNHPVDYVNTDGAFNVTSIDLLDPPLNGYNFNATISLMNPTPFSVEMVTSLPTVHYLSNQLKCPGSCRI